jgi:S-formylglutathione hydrolase
MPALETVSTSRCFGGTQAVYRHASRETGTEMVFSAYLPPQAEQGPCPVVWYLSGLTCTHANVTEKGQFQRTCAELGLIFVAPDTSPRGAGVPDDPDGAWDFGLGAGFYVDATQPPWDANYRMDSYVADELPALVAAELSVDVSRQAIMGHSMGGHGALTLALKHPGRWKSVSAFAPISSPMRCGWGEKALAGYLGDDRAVWRRYDATALIEDGARLGELLVDQGEADPFLDQLRPDLLEAACAAAAIPLSLRRRPGYDHSYYFIASFMQEHLRWHAARLG